VRILLVQARTFNPETEGPIYPLGLIYVAGALREDHDVRIADLNVLPGGDDDLVAIARDYQPEVIGYSMRNIKVGRPGVEEELVALDPLSTPLQRLRSEIPGVPIVAGGCAFGLYSRVFMERMPEIDMGVVGEGERAFPALLRNLGDPAAVGGVVYRDGDEIVGGETRAEPADFPSLSAPQRGEAPLHAYGEREFAIGIQAKRGCAMRCLHCSDRFLTGDSLRKRDPVEIVDEIENLVADHGIRSFQFVDQVFNVPAGHAEAICAEMVRRGLRVRWTAWFTTRGLTERFLRDARRCGLASLQFSPDSTNDHVLQTLRKSERREDLYEAARLAKRVGIPVSFSFFYPNPGESWRSSMQMFTFLARTKLSLRNLLWLHGRMIVRTRVYPKSDLHDMMVRDGMLPADHDLVEPVYWEPEPFRTVEQGIQVVFRTIYDTRLRLKRLGLARERR
jgi:anaerobic magnesium-protoporphyrin IX monomethyl ester cyclase